MDQGGGEPVQVKLHLLHWNQGGVLAEGRRFHNPLVVEVVVKIGNNQRRGKECIKKRKKGASRLQLASMI